MTFIVNILFRVGQHRHTEPVTPNRIKKVKVSMLASLRYELHLHTMRKKIFERVGAISMGKRPRMAGYAIAQIVEIASLRPV